MTHEPIAVQPVQMEYYEEENVLAMRVVRAVAIVAIAYGAYNTLHVGLLLAQAGMGIGWYADSVRTGAWYGISHLLSAAAGGVLSLVLLMSGIGCLSLKPRAWAGMLVYCIGVIGISLLWIIFGLIWTGYWTGNRKTEWAGAGLVMLIDYLSGPALSSLFPVLVLIVFRMREVRRLFGK